MRNESEPDPAWLVVDAAGKTVSGPYVFRFLAEQIAASLGIGHSVVPVLNRDEGAAARWPRWWQWRR
jgi:hypothetical protein